MYDSLVAEYMRLPASQYSVLDAKKIERLDDDVFICYVGGLNFLGFVINPVLKVSVIVHDRGPVVKLLETKVGSVHFTATHGTTVHACRHLPYDMWDHKHVP